MSITRNHTIHCPECEAEMSVQLYDSINVVEDPALRDALMANQLNAVECPGCQFQFRVDKPLLYIDTIRGFAIWWTPGGETREEQSFDEYRRMQESLREAPDSSQLKLHLVYDRVELVERIFLLEAGLDERIVEYIKYLIYSKNVRKVAPAAKRLLFNVQDSDDETLCFIVQDRASSRLESALKYDRKMVRELEAMFANNPTQPLTELFPHPYVSARRLLLD